MKATLAVAVVVISVGVVGCPPGGGNAKCPEVVLSQGVSVVSDTVHKPLSSCLTVMAADTVRKP